MLWGNYHFWQLHFHACGQLYLDHFFSFVIQFLFAYKMKNNPRLIQLFPCSFETIRIPLEISRLSKYNKCNMHYNKLCLTCIPDITHLILFGKFCEAILARWRSSRFISPILVFNLKRRWSSASSCSLYILIFTLLRSFTTSMSLEVGPIDFFNESIELSIWFVYRIWWLFCCGAVIGR